MQLKVAAGDEVWLGDKEFVVTELAAQCLPDVRAYLMGVARAGGIVTYGELVRDLELGYSPQGVGFLLDVLSVDCLERGEPLLASLVVTGSTLESGDFSAEGAEAERGLVYRRWLSRTIEDGGQEALGPVRGICPTCGSESVTRIVWGMPSGSDAHREARLPDWVQFGGCAVQPFNAVCDKCGQQWTADDLGRPVFNHMFELLAFAKAANEDELEGWVSRSFELDAHIEEVDYSHDRGSVAFRFLTWGTTVEFPVELADFWDQLNDVHALAEQEDDG